MVMKKETLFLVAIIALVLSVAALLVYQNLRASSTATTATSTALQNTRSQSTEEATAFATKSSNSGEVSIDITPKDIQKGVAVFAIGVNTHTVDLSPFDLKKLTTLVINGEKFTPLSAPELIGHHNQGEMTFAVTSLPETFTIVIQGIPENQERVFSWE